MRPWLLGIILSSALASTAWAQEQAPPNPRTSEPQKVELESAPRPLGGLAARRARERGEDPKPTPGDRLVGHLAKPEGSGLFPAIVVLPGCIALTAYVRDALPSLLASWGYVALTVDIFSTRNVEPNCVKEHASVDRLSDAYGGLFYLAQLPYVDRNRVGIVGVSLGGKTALVLTDPQIVSNVANPNKLAFKAGVAFYPFCDVWHEMPTFPILLIIGQKDRSKHVADCERLAARRAGSIELVLRPEAHHGFIERDWSTAKEAFGIRFEYNEQAAEDSLRQAREFLAKNLGAVTR